MNNHLRVNEETFLGINSGIASNCANRLYWDEKQRKIIDFCQ